jgi:hypothetical protein
VPPTDSADDFRGLGSLQNPDRSARWQLLAALAENAMCNKKGENIAVWLLGLEDFKFL